jgi:hypothetical protein
LTDYLGTYVYRAPNGLTYVRHCFIARPDRHDPDLTLDDGIIGAHWVNAESILGTGFNARSPMVVKAVQDFLNGRRLPLDTVFHYF